MPRRYPLSSPTNPAAAAATIERSEAARYWHGSTSWCYGGVAQGGVTEGISQRQMRNDSGAILRRVEAGESFVVTNRGVRVARLVPYDVSAPDERDALVASGVLVPRGLRSTDLPVPMDSQVDLAAALDDDRAG